MFTGSLRFEFFTWRTIISGSAGETEIKKRNVDYSQGKKKKEPSIFLQHFYFAKGKTKQRRQAVKFQTDIPCLLLIVNGLSLHVQG